LNVIIVGNTRKKKPKQKNKSNKNRMTADRNAIQLFDENMAILRKKTLQTWINENKHLDHNLLESAFAQEFLNRAQYGLTKGVEDDQRDSFDRNIQDIRKILFEDDNPNNLKIVLNLRIIYENLVSPHLGDQIV
jgi:hypothetical protein